jgi:hypothetical protein
MSWRFHRPDSLDLLLLIVEELEGDRRVFSVQSGSNSPEAVGPRSSSGTTIRLRPSPKPQSAKVVSWLNQGSWEPSTVEGPAADLAFIEGLAAPDIAAGAPY